ILRLLARTGPRLTEQITTITAMSMKIPFRTRLLPLLPPRPRRRPRSGSRRAFRLWTLDFIPARLDIRYSFCAPLGRRPADELTTRRLLEKRRFGSHDSFW